GTDENGSRYRYRYPAQEFKVKVGDQASRLDTLKDVFIVAIDELALTIDLDMRLGQETEPPTTLSIAVGKPLDNEVIRKAVVAYANALCAGNGKFNAVTEFLQRAIPHVRSTTRGAALMTAGADTLSESIRVVRDLNDSYLFIQGPPGTGKTYTGSHI